MTDPQTFVNIGGDVYHCTAVVANSHVATACGREQPIDKCGFSDMLYGVRLCRTCRKVTTQQLRDDPTFTRADPPAP
jgi:hypothetical protein